MPSHHFAPLARAGGSVFGAARPMVEAEMPPTRRRYASKWLTLVLCEAVMMSSGTLYLFPVYSPTLKRTLDLTQEQLNFVGSAAHFGAFFSVFGGLFFDAFGPRATLALGGSLKLAGLGALYGIIAGFAPQSHLFAAFCAWVFGTGCSTSLTAALGANYATFKDRGVHGRLVGLLLSFFGLSSGFLSLLYDVFFTDPVAFVRFLALLAGGIDLCASSVVGAPKHLALPPEESLGGLAAGSGAAIAFARNEKRGVSNASWPVSARAFFAPAGAETKLARGQAATAATAAAVAVVAAALYASGSSPFVAVACLLGLTAMLAAQAATLLAGSGRLTYRRQDMESVDATGGEDAKRDAARGAHVGPSGLFASPDFYLLFFSLALGLGAGITVINNLSQMVGAYPAFTETSAGDAQAQSGGFSHGLIKLLACANTLGRLFSGSASDFLSARRSRDAVTRTEFTTWCFVLMSCGMALLLIVPDASPAPLLALGVGVVGWSFGSLFWAMPTLVMELFGSKHFGANRGIVGLSPAIGGYLLSTKVAGRVYAAAAADGVECAAGGACFRNAWGINLACATVAALACAALARRDRRRADAARGAGEGTTGGR
jgi:MFS family permease